mmetsp:Transcript_20594/g.40459  ORF Transcript_20594/g.40459 Transcript_20594/m.40459 type:complete len:537 (+) Transcript_20594:1324-2934(+)
MTVGKGTTLGVLATDADVLALKKEGTISEELSTSPVNVLTGADHLKLVLEELLDGTVGRESLRRLEDNLTDVLEDILIDTGGLALGKLANSGLTLPLGVDPLVVINVLVRLGGFAELLLVDLHDHVLDRGHVCLVAEAGLDGVGAVLVKNARGLLDDLVHVRLSEEGLIHLVVAVAAVANHVDDNIRVVLVTVVSGDLEDVRNGLGVVSVHVEDRTVESTTEVSAVASGAALTRISGETDLVVNNDVNAATSLVVRESAHVHGLVYDTLATESGITVDKHRHGAVALLVVVVVLLGAGLTDDDRVNSLKVGRVGSERKLDLATVGVLALVSHTQVVLDITTDSVVITTETLEHGLVLNTKTLELEEDLVEILANHVGDDVKAATVRHTDNDILNSVEGSLVDEGLETRDEGLSTLETEAFSSVPLGGQEGLPHDGEGQTLEDLKTLLLGEAILDGVRLLEALTDEVALFAVHDVHVLETDIATVGLLERAEDLAELSRAVESEDALDLLLHTGEVELTLEVGLSEAVGAVVQVREI